MWGQVVVTSRSMAAQSAAMIEPDARRALISELITFAVVLKNHLRDEPTEAIEIAAASAIRPTADDGKLGALLTAPSAPNCAVEAIAHTLRAGLKKDELATSSYLFLSGELKLLTQASDVRDVRNVCSVCSLCVTCATVCDVCDACDERHTQSCWRRPPRRASASRRRRCRWATSPRCASSSSCGSSRCRSR